MKKIIVTGGAGYIGSHTVVELFNSGFTPIIIDNLCNSSDLNLKGINQINGTRIKHYNVDCTNSVQINKIFSEEKNIKGVIHFAAFKEVEESVQYPEKYYKNKDFNEPILLKYKDNLKTGIVEKFLRSPKSIPKLINI